jgi:hypothetical protein
MIEVPMTDAQFVTATERLRTHGIELSGPSGTLSKEGITGKYEHADGKLRIEIVDKPFFIPMSLIEGRMKAFLQQSFPAVDETS